MNAINKKITLVLHATIICLFCLNQIRAENVNLDYFVGDWTVNNTSEYNGQLTSSTGTSSMRKYGADYYIASEQIIAGQGVSTSTAWYYANGYLAGETRLNGALLSLVTGTWYFSGDTLYVVARQEGVNFDFDQSITYTLVNPNRMIGVSDTSYGARIIGESSRILPPSITSDLSTVSIPKGKLIPRFTITTNFGAKTFAAKGLPKGLKLNTKTGVISGKPTKAGTYTVTLTAKKMKGKKVEQQATATKVVIVY
jgi:hypothetical protein